MDAKDTKISSLYSANQIGGASFIGSPLAGFLLLSSNYKAINNRVASRHSLIWGFCISFIFCVILYFLPDKFPNMLFPIVNMFLMQMLAKKLQGDIYSKHMNQGWLKGSSGKAIGSSILGIVLFFAIYITFEIGAEKIEYAYYENFDGVRRVKLEQNNMYVDYTYKNGIVNGPAIAYYESGSLYEDTNYINNELDGAYNRFYESGELMIESTYKKGQLNGVAKTYYKSGKLLSEGEYRDDVFVAGKNKTKSRTMNFI